MLLMGSAALNGRPLSIGGGHSKLTVDQEVGGSSPPSCTNRVMRNFTILILLLSGRDIIIDVTRLVVGAMLVALRCWLILIQIDGKLERGRKLRDFIVAIRSGFLAQAIIGRRAPLVTVSLSDQSREFCNGIAFSAGSETFATHRSTISARCAGARSR